MKETTTETKCLALLLRFKVAARGQCLRHVSLVVSRGEGTKIPLLFIVSRY